jgi:hypothetical protein
VARVTVQVRRDHLERLAGVNPIEGIAELVWNSLDADARKVEIRLVQNNLLGIEVVEVIDDGGGIPYSDVESAFRNLGNSLKKHKFLTNGNRHIHGKRGQGRFRAFSIGNHIEWDTRSKLNGGVEGHVIIGDQSQLGTFVTSDKPTILKGGTVGTRVTITDILPNAEAALTSEKSRLRLTEEFALYLRQYPNAQVSYDGQAIDPRKIEKDFKNYKLDSLEAEDGRTIAPDLTIIEWSNQTERSLHICDEHGFSLMKTTSDVRAPGFHFTAYLKSAFFRELADRNALVELHADLTKFIERAREKIRKHFKDRESEMGATILSEWKAQGIYPYREPPTNRIERNERQVFEVVALNVNKYLHDFDRTDQQNKRLTLQLVRAAIEQGPKALRRILEDVLNLPRTKQEEFGRLLDKTSLAAIINAATTVADRLNFLEGLKKLVHDPQTREEIKERKQLHKILERESWIFGESFNLALSDRGLTEVLSTHLAHLGRKPVKSPVKTASGQRGIIDLMMSKQIRQDKEWRNLVVELKLPKQDVDLKTMAQVQKYAFAVAADPRFDAAHTEWVFWAVSRVITREVRESSKQANRPLGLVHDALDKRVYIWVKSWGELIQEAEARLQFFREQLEYSSDDQSAVDYLHRLHSQYLPSSLLVG